MQKPWLLGMGFLGQALFAGRFVVQWWVSERGGRSLVPFTFWVLSVAGGVVMLAYALLRKDPVFVLGQAGGLAVYGRNLVLLRRRGARAAAGEMRT